MVMITSGDPLQAGNIERERLTSLINSMADGVIAISKSAQVILYNGAALNILDLNNVMAGKDLAELVDLYDKEDQIIDMHRYISQVKTITTTRDLHIKYQDESSVNLYLSIAPVHLGYGQDNEQGGYVIILRDITREKSLEQERDEFISVISHELRTPVTIAEGNISNVQFLIEKSGDSAQIKKALAQTYTQINFLAGLINDLSTLSRAEQGKLKVEIDSINVHELIDELADDYKPEADKKALQLFTQIDSSLELLKSSRLYVREILQNFLTNAIKYTEQGSITISAKPDTNSVLFMVSDTGIGISQSDQRSVFQKFFRSEDYRTRKNNGTGLGLYVTMKLAKLVKAEISVHSELNRGTAFSIRIPNLS